jgi:phosphate-selective porin
MWVNLRASALPLTTHYQLQICPLGLRLFRYALIKLWTNKMTRVRQFMFAVLALSLAQTGMVVAQDSNSYFATGSQRIENRPNLESPIIDWQAEQEKTVPPTPAQDAAKGKTDDVDSKEAKPEKKEEKKSEKKEEKPKEWYEKIKLRGYTQFRYNYQTHYGDGSAPRDHAGDGSISPDQEFLIRRARIILQGDVGEHLGIYLQPDFASTPNASVDAIQFAQIRDFYGDVYLDKEKVHRIRVGQSKIPYGWENLQSSRDRLYLDRNDAFNSAARNERDTGAFYYWTPKWAQDTFKFISDEGLKGSGNYGIFGFGAYNGQGGSFREQNDQLHLISRLTIPYTDNCGRLMEFGIQAYTGNYVVLGTPISPLGVGAAVSPIGTKGRPFGDNGKLDQRLGWSYVLYPQPFGFQAEYTIGRGPELNAAQTEVIVDDLHGGYAMVNYRHQTACYGELWPFARYQYYRGGYKSATNAPYSEINEWNLGLEWQITKDFELVTEYLITDRTNLRSLSSGRSYDQFDGDMLRFQFQINY